MSVQLVARNGLHLQAQEALAGGALGYAGLHGFHGSLGGGDFLVHGFRAPAAGCERIAPLDLIGHAIVLGRGAAGEGVFQVRTVESEHGGHDAGAVRTGAEGVFHQVAQAVTIWISRVCCGTQGVIAAEVREAPLLLIGVGRLSDEVAGRRGEREYLTARLQRPLTIRQCPCARVVAGRCHVAEIAGLTPREVEQVEGRVVGKSRRVTERERQHATVYEAAAADIQTVVIRASCHTVDLHERLRAARQRERGHGQNIDCVVDYAARGTATRGQCARRHDDRTAKGAGATEIAVRCRRRFSGDRAVHQELAISLNRGAARVGIDAIEHPVVLRGCVSDRHAYLPACTVVLNHTVDCLSTLCDSATADQAQRHRRRDASDRLIEVGSVEGDDADVGRSDVGVTIQIELHVRRNRRTGGSEAERTGLATGSDVDGESSNPSDGQAVDLHSALLD